MDPMGDQSGAKGASTTATATVRTGTTYCGSDYTRVPWHMVPVTRANLYGAHTKRT